MVFQEQRLWIEHGRVLSKKQSLYLDKVYVLILRTGAWEAWSTSLLACIAVFVRIGSRFSPCVNRYMVMSLSILRVGSTEILTVMMMTVVSDLLWLGCLVLMLHLWGQRETLTDTHLILVWSGRWLLATLVWVLELCIEIGVDIQRLYLLIFLHFWWC